MVWTSGELAHVKAGVHDVQGLLEVHDEYLSVIHWHANWLAASIDIVPFVESVPSIPQDSLLQAPSPDDRLTSYALLRAV